MDALSTLALALGASWVSGIRLYGCVFTLGLLGRFQLVALPGSLNVLTDPWVIGVSGAMFVAEFFADKVAWFDSVWDAVHTFVRIPAGAALAWAAYAHTDARVQVIAALAGGSLALSSHGVKASVRALANHSPEPVSNVMLSLAEDASAGAVTALALLLPLVAVGVVAALFVASFFMIRGIVRALRGLYRRDAKPV